MTDTELATFDADLAAAVVRVLRRHGVQAWVAEQPTEDGRQRAVHVAAPQREPAFAVLADRMEEVHRELAERRPAAAERPEHEQGPSEPPGTRPLVMERFRRIGLNVAVLLAPLLVVSLARPPFPVAIALLTLVGGIALIVVLRERQRHHHDR